MSWWCGTESNWPSGLSCTWKILSAVPCAASGYSRPPPLALLMLQQGLWLWPRSIPVCANRAFISAPMAQNWTEYRVQGHALLQLSKTLQATVLLCVPFPSRLSTLGRALHGMTTHPRACKILAIDTMDGSMAQRRRVLLARRKHCLQPTS